MTDVHSNPDPSEREPGVSKLKATLLGRGTAGTGLWFLLIFGAVLALALVANRCGDDKTNADEVATAAAPNDGEANDGEPEAAPEATATPEPQATATPEPTAAPAPTETPEPAPEPTAVPLAPSAAAITINDAGTVTVSGTVADEAARALLITAAAGIAGGEANVIDELVIDGDTTTNEGGTVTVVGKLEEATATQFEERLASLPGGPLLDFDTSGLEIIASADVVAQLNELFALNPIQFATGSAEILAESEPVLDDVAAILVTAPGLNLDVEGHTDNTGDPASNLSLSLSRAEAVRDYLIAAGIGEERLTAVGAGDTTPIADNNTDAGRQQNRRIEFSVTS